MKILEKLEQFPTITQLNPHKINEGRFFHYNRTFLIEEKDLNNKISYCIATLNIFERILLQVFNLLDLNYFADKKVCILSIDALPSFDMKAHSICINNFQEPEATQNKKRVEQTIKTQQIENTKSVRSFGGITVFIGSYADGETLKIHYLIGGTQVNDKKLETLRKNLTRSISKGSQSGGLELLTVNSELKEKLNLPENFKGYAVLIQKHEAEDPEHTEQELLLQLAKEEGQNVNNIPTGRQQRGFDAEECYRHIRIGCKEILGVVPVDEKSLKSFDAAIEKHKDILPFLPPYAPLANIRDRLEQDIRSYELSIAHSFS